ncbi:hypothetical protein, partial [Serratia fonticola]
RKRGGVPFAKAHALTAAVPAGFIDTPMPVSQFWAVQGGGRGCAIWTTARPGNSPPVILSAFVQLPSINNIILYI